MRNFFGVYIHGDRNKNEISLTFDDGPSDETLKVLDVLKKNKIKATFFILSKRIKGREYVIKRIIEEGHEIGNHSNSHKRLLFKSRKDILKELDKCDKELQKFNIKTNLFRPPYLSIGFSLLSLCKQTERKIIACDVISSDWKKLGIDNIVKKVLKETQNGSILNFHDYIEGIGKNKDLPRILEKALPILKSKFKFVLISKLIK